MANDQYTKNPTRLRMVEKAIELFKARGVDNVSVKEICDAAEVTRNAFYYHFSNRDLLFEDISAWLVRRSKYSIVPLGENESSFQQLWECYKSYLNTQIELGHDIMSHVCHVLVQPNHIIYGSYLDQDLIPAMIKLIRASQQSGEVQNPTDSALLLSASYAIVRGFNISWCFNSGKTALLEDARKGLNALFLPNEGFELK